MGKIVSFGKYKGQPVELMAADRAYCDWLTAQPWFRDRFGDVYNVIINYGGEPAETPEHNAMQARFLDLHFRIAVLKAAMPEFPVHIGEYRRADAWGRYFHTDQEITITETPIGASDAKFEVDGWDVVVMLAVSIKARGWRVSRVKPGIEPEGRWGAPGAAEQAEETAQESISTYVECKPTMGDDYPAVLRQIMRYKYREYEVVKILLLGEYTGAAVPLASVRAIFAASKIRLVLVSEVEERLA